MPVWRLNSIILQKLESQIIFCRFNNIKRINKEFIFDSIAVTLTSTNCLINNNLFSSSHVFLFFVELFSIFFIVFSCYMFINICFKIYNNFKNKILQNKTMNFFRNIMRIFFLIILVIWMFCERCIVWSNSTSLILHYFE